MNLSIEDSLGLETGVLIQNVKASSDEDNNMKIFGQMRKREGKYVNLFLEPEIVCDLVDTAGAILYSTVSRHSGCFWASAYTTFEITIPKRKILDEVFQIRLRLIFKKERGA
ncbi:hypothetical protein DW974_16310 [Lachnospiraceae bacterium AM48-27BH]|nr:hypothetical protein DW974_16310 [Lachnospiraceae bacterium AM48-27BH]